MGPTCDSNFCKKSNFRKCQDRMDDCQAMDAATKTETQKSRVLTDS